MRQLAGGTHVGHGSMHRQSRTLLPPWSGAQSAPFQTNTLLLSCFRGGAVSGLAAAAVQTCERPEPRESLENPPVGTERSRERHTLWARGQSGSPSDVRRGTQHPAANGCCRGPSRKRAPRRLSAHYFRQCHMHIRLGALAPGPCAPPCDVVCVLRSPA